MTKRNISVSVYTPETLLDQANYAAKTAASTIDYFENFFGAEYPLPKLGKIEFHILNSFRFIPVKCFSQCVSHNQPCFQKI